MWARVRLRARCAAVKMGEKMRFFFAIFIITMGGGAFFSRATARTSKWCAPIDFPDQGDDIDYLIANFAQKAEKIKDQRLLGVDTDSRLQNF